MSSIDRIERSVVPDFAEGTTSKPIYIGNAAWGSIFTGSDLGSVTTLTFKAPFKGKNDLDVDSPGTLRTIRDSSNTELSAKSVAANQQYQIPSDVFHCDWLVLVADANVADNSMYRLVLKG